MSSPPKQELKGGHPPAVKVSGGMRISQHKNQRHSDVKLAEDSETVNAALKVSTSPEKQLTVSGAPIHGNKDFPAEAVQSFHVKPVPTVEAHANAKPHIIQQPRK